MSNQNGLGNAFHKLLNSKLQLSPDQISVRGDDIVDLDLYGEIFTITVKVDDDQKIPSDRLDEFTRETYGIQDKDGSVAGALKVEQGDINLKRQTIEFVVKPKETNL